MTLFDRFTNDLTTLNKQLINLSVFTCTAASPQVLRFERMSVHYYYFLSTTRARHGKFAFTKTDLLFLVIIIDYLIIKLRVKYCALSVFIRWLFHDKHILISCKKQVMWCTHHVKYCDLNRSQYYIAICESRTNKDNVFNLKFDNGSIHSFIYLS